MKNLLRLRSVSEFGGMLRAASTFVAERWLDACAGLSAAAPVPREFAMRVGAHLTATGRFDDADALFERALGRWPDRPRLLNLYALNAHDSGRGELALTRWDKLRRVDPTWPMAWVGLAANHRALGHLSEAEAMIRDALLRFPTDLVVASEAARLFSRIGAFEEACLQWRRLCALQEVHEDWFQGYAFSLIHSGRHDEAETLLDRADAVYPDNRDLLSTRAMLETERGNWPAALPLWQAYRARFPDDQAGWEGQGKMLAAIQAERIEHTARSADAVKIDIEIVDDDARRRLLLGFESLGTDCEFGLVQRRFGAEPLGLLRFNDVQVPDLLSALDSRFDGMGEPDHTTMFVVDSGEFYVADRRWGLGMHTFLFSGSHDSAILFPKMCRRIVYLREKFLEDLRGGTKTLVLKSNAIDGQGLRALHRALRAFGPVRLLNVRSVGLPDATPPLLRDPGTIAVIAPDLYVGFLSRMGNIGTRWDIPFEEWIAICERVAVAAPDTVVTKG